MSEATWQCRQGDAVLSVPQIMERVTVGTIIENGDPIPKPENTVHIPLSKIDFVITRTEYSKKYAEFVVRSVSFYVIDSPEVRDALKYTRFENVFSEGEDNEQ